MRRSPILTTPSTNLGSVGWGLGALSHQQAGRRTSSCIWYKVDQGERKVTMQPDPTAGSGLGLRLKRLWLRTPPDGSGLGSGSGSNLGSNLKFTGGPKIWVNSKALIGTFSQTSGPTCEF